MAKGNKSSPHPQRRARKPPPPRKRRNGGGGSKRSIIIGGGNRYILERSAALAGRRHHPLSGARNASANNPRWTPPPPSRYSFAEEYRRYRNDAGRDDNSGDGRLFHPNNVRPHRNQYRGGSGASPSQLQCPKRASRINRSGSNRNFNSRNKKNTTASTSTTLPPIKVKASGIHASWKKALGGLIRYYVHQRTNNDASAVDQKTAEEEIDQLYYRSNCDVHKTKEALLKALGVQVVPGDDWVTVDMAIVKDSTVADMTNNLNYQGYKETVDGKGILLNQVLRPGEGPAHNQKQWTTIVVPEWAMHKSYYFQIKNHTSLDLSCELFLDGGKVAFNAPLSAYSTRTVRPDGVRYYQRHEWILSDALRVKLGNNGDNTTTAAESESTANQCPTLKLKASRSSLADIGTLVLRYN